MESYGMVTTLCMTKDSISLKPLQEQKALKHLKNMVEYRYRYTVRNLSKENWPSLPFNKLLALSRFNSLEKKFEQTEFANKYKEINKQSYM